MPSGVTDGLTAAVDVGGTVITFLTGNPIAMIFLGVSLFGAGFAIYKRLKG